MRRLLVAWCAVLALVVVGPTIGAAQEATPTAGAAAGLMRTDLRVLLPYSPDGLNPALTASAPEDGLCAFDSSQALDRPDAWECTSASNQIYDPCFENPFVPIDEPGQVACFDSPFSTNVVVLNLTQPLVREKEAMDDAAQAAAGGPTGDYGQMTGADQASVTDQASQASDADHADDTVPDETVIDPWDLPWGVELANGDQCTLLRGAITVMAGHEAHYSCANGGTILGEVDRSDPVWTVNYLADGAFASNLVDVVAAWS